MNNKPINGENLYIRKFQNLLNQSTKIYFRLFMFLEVKQTNANWHSIIAVIWKRYFSHLEYVILTPFKALFRILFAYSVFFYWNTSWNKISNSYPNNLFKILKSLCFFRAVINEEGNLFCYFFAPPQITRFNIEKYVLPQYIPWYLEKHLLRNTPIL